MVRRPSPDSPLRAEEAQHVELRAQPTTLRRALLSLVTVTSAVLVAYLFRSTDVAPMLPRTVLAGGSIVCLAAATLGLLAWRRRGPSRILYVLYWIGICWGALFIL